MRVGWQATYEKKFDEDNPDRSDLEALVAVLDATPDGQLLAALEQHVDLDAFLTFWAMENLIGHWDGYSGNLNNHFLYREPTSGRFHFMPWGPDLTFVHVDPFTPAPRPHSVSAHGWLTRRLYAIPEVRQMYVARMRELLDTVWNEAALLAELDRIQALLAPYVEDPVAFAAQVDKVRLVLHRGAARLRRAPPGSGRDGRRRAGDRLLHRHGAARDLLGPNMRDRRRWLRAARPW